MKKTIAQPGGLADSLAANPRMSADRILVRLVWNAVRSVVAQVPPLRGRWVGGPDPRQLLGLLTYCYATGLYATEDIEHAARRCGLPQGLVPREGLSAELLQAFRRANRPWIEESLARVFAAWPEGAAWFGSSAELTLPGQRGYEACRRAARRAVELATLFDTALAD